MEPRVIVSTRHVFHAFATDSVPLPVQLLPGDVLIMGSDGLWDNVDDNEILDLVLTVR